MVTRTAKRVIQSMFSEVSNCGLLQFMLYAALFITFLRRLVKDAGQKAWNDLLPVWHHRGTAMEHYAGIDVSLEQSSVCVVDGTGRIVREAKVPSEPEALVRFFGQLCSATIGVSGARQLG